MFGKMKAMLVLSVVVLMAGICLAEAPKVLEIEDFTIQNGTVVENKDASNGKAVVANDLSFVATKTIKMEQGIYEFVMFENAPNGASDAINISINDMYALRTYPNEATDMGKFAPCIKKLIFNCSEPGDYTIKVYTSNEKGALYDKLEVSKIK